MRPGTIFHQHRRNGGCISCSAQRPRRFATASVSAVTAFAWGGHPPHFSQEGMAGAGTGPPSQYGGRDAPDFAGRHMAGRPSTIRSVRVPCNLGLDALSQFTVPTRPEDDRPGRLSFRLLPAWTNDGRPPDLYGVASSVRHPRWVVRN